MRTLHYAGTELVTSDGIAEALLDYIVTLPLNHPPHRVTLPAMRDDHEVVAHLVVTAETALLVTTSDAPHVALDGEQYAIDVLRHHTHRLDSIGVETRGLNPFA